MKFSFIVFVTGWLFWGSKKKNKTDKSDKEPQEEKKKQEEIIPPQIPTPPIFDKILPLATPEKAIGLMSNSAQSCQSCHGQIYDQWKESSHHTGNLSEVFREKIALFGNSTACTQCHLPLQSQHHQLSTSYYDNQPNQPIFTKNPNWDATLMSEGVGCMTCHIREGKILGKNGSKNSPHQNIVSLELQNSRVCSTCHQYKWAEEQDFFYDTYGEWERSPYPKAGIDCQDCHMNQVALQDGMSSFYTLANHDIKKSPQRAITTTLIIESPIIQRGVAYPMELKVQNTGSGHAFPTGNPWKSYSILTQIKLNGEVEKIHQIELKREFDEKNIQIKDTRIAPGKIGNWNFSLMVPQEHNPGKGILEVILLDHSTEYSIWMLPIEIR